MVRRLLMVLATALMAALPGPAGAFACDGAAVHHARAAAEQHPDAMADMPVTEAASRPNDGQAPRHRDRSGACGGQACCLAACCGTPFLAAAQPQTGSERWAVVFRPGLPVDARQPDGAAQDTIKRPPRLS